MVRNTVNNFIEWSGGRKSSQASEFVDRRFASGHVFEAGLVGFGVRNKPCFGGGIQASDHPTGEIEDRDFMRAADIDDFSNRSRCVLESDQRFDGILHVAEAASLRPIPVHQERFIAQCSLHKARQHHPVATGLARADCVEESGDDHGKVSLGVICEREKFIHELGTRIAPATESGRTNEEIIVLGERRFAAFAVDFGSRSEKDWSAGSGSGEQYDFGLLKIGFNGSYRGYDDKFNPDGGGQMEDECGARTKNGKVGTLGDGTLDHLQVRMIQNSGEISDGTGGAIIDHRNAVPFEQEALDQV